MSAFWSVVLGAVAVIVVAGLCFAWLMHRHGKVNGEDHDFGMYG